MKFVPYKEEEEEEKEPELKVWLVVDGASITIEAKDSRGCDQTILTVDQDGWVARPHFDLKGWDVKRLKILK